MKKAIIQGFARWDYFPVGKGLRPFYLACFANESDVVLWAVHSMCFVRDPEV